MTSPDSVENQSAKKKQGVVLQAALRLVSQIPGEISSYEYGILGDDLEADGEFAEAEDYFKRAVNASTTTFQRTQAFRMLALYYFTPGPKRDVEKGRAAFNDAANVMGHPSDPYSVQIAGLNYEAWAATESRAGFAKEAPEKAELARTFYKQLPPDYPFRAHLIDDLDRRVTATSAIEQRDMPLGFSGAVPPDIAQVFQQLSADDLRVIAENDLESNGSMMVEGGSDNTPNDEQRNHYQRLVAVGLATFLSKTELREASRKERMRFVYGVRPTPLYPRTREFVFTMLTAMIARGTVPQ